MKTRRDIVIWKDVCGFLGLTGTILALIGYLTNIAWMGFLDRISYGLLVSFLILSAICARCPYCRKRGLNPRSWKPNAGHCKYCDQLIEYECS